MLGATTQPPVELRDSTVFLRVKQVGCRAKVLNGCPFLIDKSHATK